MIETVRRGRYEIRRRRVQQRSASALFVDQRQTWLGPAHRILQSNRIASHRSKREPVRVVAGVEIDMRPGRAETSKVGFGM